MDTLVHELLNHPEGMPLSLEQEIALEEILSNFLARDDFFQKLAESSAGSARIVLQLIAPQLWSGAVAELERIICRVEEAREALSMSTMSDEELETRLTLLALLPGEAPETERTARVLARVLAARSPARVLEMSKTPWGGDVKFWNRLRYELSWYFAGKHAA